MRLNRLTGRISRRRGLAFIILFALGVLSILWGGRPHYYDFPQAKRVMEERVIYDHRLTIYCGAAFDSAKTPTLPDGFVSRSGVPAGISWEHAVPVSAFGPGFPEWHDPPPYCQRGGKHIPRRQCTEATNARFRRMVGDMYNLFPALTEVNMARGAREFAQLPTARPQFGSCGMKLARKKFEPPDVAKGPLARAALYMAREYDEFTLNPEQRALLERWNGQFPVERWECKRSKRIERLQGNENIFVKIPCKKAGLW